MSVSDDSKRVIFVLDEARMRTTLRYREFPPAAIFEANQLFQCPQHRPCASAEAFPAALRHSLPA